MGRCWRSTSWKVNRRGWSPADCKQSEACAKERFCVAKGNNCIMSEADRQEADKLAAARAAAAAKEMEGRVEPPPEYDED